MSKNITHMQRVEDAFIAEIREHGLAHALRWVDGWYAKAAEAEVQDSLNQALGAHAENEEACELQLLDVLLSHAERSADISTSAGHNLFNQSLIAARAKMLNGVFSSLSGDTPCSRQGRQRRWEVLRANLKADSTAPTSA